MKWQDLLGVFSIRWQRPLKPGTLAGRYIVKTTLGMGSYGITYLAQDRETNQTVVLKQMRKRKNRSDLQSFQKEKEILKTLNHPDIPSFYEEFAIDHEQFLVMEYKKGETFEQLIFQHGKKFAEGDAFYYLKHILEIVRYIHNQKIVHRDLRIPNILLHDDRISIIDFGLARFISDEQEENFDQWEPEKQRMREIRYQTDFYALGHFLLFLLYSSFEPMDKKERSWEEELTISSEGKRIIKKLFRMEGCYQSAEDILNDIERLPIGRKKNGVV